MKRHPPDLEDQIFVREVNGKLMGRASIDLFSVEPDNGAREYRLVMSHRGYRHTIGSTSPFPFEGVAEIVRRVERWLGALTDANARWTTDPAHA